MKKYLIIIILSVFIGVLFDIVLKSLTNKNTVQHISPIISKQITPISTVYPTPILPTPTVKPITIEDLNAKFGPCTNIKVLMYHHIQPLDIAKKSNQQNLTVTPDIFKKQMEYLKTKGYTPVFPKVLSDFFDNNISLPKKPVILTFDDAYEDNYSNAFPILQEYGFKATIFVPTGLVTVSDYLNWDEIKSMSNSGLIYFGNHTWSHQNSATTLQKLDMEIGTANSQLSEKSLNSDKVFAYPFGSSSKFAEEILSKYNYKLAFTTVHGSIACKAKRFDIPRIRVGNAPLSQYGL